MRTLYNQPSQLPSEIAVSKGFVGGLMGLPYHGKTSLLPTLLPKYGPVAAFDMGGGTYVLPDMPEDVQIWAPDNWITLAGMIDEVASAPAPFKTIWVDAVSFMQHKNIAFHDIHGKSANDKRGRQILYGESNWDVVANIHTKLIEAAASKGINVFFVYWITRPQQQEGGESPSLMQRHIYLSPTVGVMVNGILDILVEVHKTPGLAPYPPTLTLDGDQSLETKIRLSPTNPLKRWPNTVQANPTILSDMIDAFKGEVNDRYVK